MTLNNPETRLSCCEYFTSLLLAYEVTLAAINKSFDRAIRIALSITSFIPQDLAFSGDSFRSFSKDLWAASILNDRQML